MYELPQQFFECCGLSQHAFVHVLGRMVKQQVMCSTGRGQLGWTPYPVTASVLQLASLPTFGFPRVAGLGSRGGMGVGVVISPRTI
jgi:hypothetical protein